MQDGRARPGHRLFGAARLELVGEADKSKHQPVAEFASIGKSIDDAARAYERRGAECVFISEVDIAKFRACSPIGGEHVLGTNASRPSELRQVLAEGLKRADTK